MTIDLYIGPVTARNGSFGYDTFSRADGLRSSFRYRRVEQARYDQRAMIGEYRSAANTRVQVYETVAEFERAVSAERKEGEDASAIPPNEE
ncbi:MAG: hypothetical protein WA417_15730 [Stellaceae bacterium]